MDSEVEAGPAWAEGFCGVRWMTQYMQEYEDRYVINETRS